MEKNWLKFTKKKGYRYIVLINISLLLIKCIFVFKRAVIELDPEKDYSFRV